MSLGGLRPKSSLIYGFQNRTKQDGHGQIPDAISEKIDNVFGGQEVVVSQPGTNQDAPLASALVALNCARVVAVKETQGIQGSVLLAELMDPKVVSVSCL